MSSNTDPESITGGCQCGAIRYTITFGGEFSWPPDSMICHCTMCRKVIGTLFPQFLHIPMSRLQPPLDSSPKFKRYPSSPGHFRGFCSECGSSFTYEEEDSDRISVTIGTLDEECLKKYGRILGTPGTKQLWTENRIPGVTDLLKGGKEHPQDDSD